MHNFGNPNQTQSMKACIIQIKNFWKFLVLMSILATPYISQLLIPSYIHVRCHKNKLVFIIISINSCLSTAPSPFLSASRTCKTLTKHSNTDNLNTFNLTQNYNKCKLRAQNLLESQAYNILYVYGYNVQGASCVTQSYLSSLSVIQSVMTVIVSNCCVSTCRQH